MTNLLLIFANEFKKIPLQAKDFANESWKEKSQGIHFRQIEQNSRNLGKLVPTRFAFYKIDIFKGIFSNY